MAHGSKNPWLVYAGRIVPIIASRQHFALVVNGRSTLSDASTLEWSQDLLSRQLLHPGLGGSTGPDQQCPLRLEWFQLLPPISPSPRRLHTPGEQGEQARRIPGRHRRTSQVRIRGVRAGDH